MRIFFDNPMFGAMTLGALGLFILLCAVFLFPDWGNEPSPYEENKYD